LAQLDDAQRENAIQFAHHALVAAGARRDKIAAWRVLRKLVRSRSPEAIARLERERGLVRSS
jgi:hypothetical protein